MDQRIEFAMKALRTENFRALCVEYGISAKTGYKWRDRLLRWGVEGLAEQSRRPHQHPEQLHPEVVCELVRLKQLHPYWGPRKIRALYQRIHGQAASESSFKRMLARAGMALGIDLERGRLGHPQDNGAHERMHRDIGTELEPRTAEQEALDLWRQEFNHERPHEALGMKCPGEV